jgi:hypothetical protein
VHDPLALVVVDDVGDDDQSDADRHHAQSGPQDFGLVVILPLKNKKLNSLSNFSQITFLDNYISQ